MTDRPAERAHRTARDTDTPMAMPSLGRALLLAWRAFRLRCPHCGDGNVLKRSGDVRARCSGCNLLFQRGPANYFSGAMFFGVMLGEFAFVTTFGIALVAMWPDVPWTLFSYAFPIGVGILALLLIPFSKVVWLAVDTLVRPVQPYELL